jgi:flavorubredoxin
MYCIKKVTDDLTWVGADDRRLAMFEGVYSVPKGVSYNSYLLNDAKTVLFDTVDAAVRERFLENITHALDGRALDYLVVQHMEPDHSASLKDIVRLYPGVKIICSAKAADLMRQFFNLANGDVITVKENDKLVTGRHTLRFLAAPMVHWPEVIVTYDETDGTLFSADAFGCFGALNGAMFADQVDIGRDYIGEYRRYSANIAGKYGPQTRALLNKVSGLNVKILCPLHGFVWREHLQTIIGKYEAWSGYVPEEPGVLIAYASVYGNTENAAELLACRLYEQGVKAEVFDVSVTPASEIIAAAFRYSHLVFASTTYNAGIFVTMEALINDLVAHSIQNRRVGIIENGSWASVSGKLIGEKLMKCKDLCFTDNHVSLKSSVNAAALDAINQMAGEIAADIRKQAEGGAL